jgi:hypothetical protein
MFVLFYLKGGILMKLIRSITLAVLFALLISIFPAAAANDSGITLNTSIPVGSSSGTFTSLGINNNGVDFCTGGTVSNYSYQTTVKGKQVTMIRWTFICNVPADGTFILDEKPSTRAGRPSSWTVVGGTLKFTAMWGSGSGTLPPAPSDTKLSTFTGNFHFR